MFARNKSRRDFLGAAVAGGAAEIAATGYGPLDDTNQAPVEVLRAFVEQMLGQSPIGWLPIVPGQ